MLTKAQVVAEPGVPFAWEDIEVDDELREDEVLIEMKASGICHTDLNYASGTTVEGAFPAVLGHEGAGIVLKLGSKASHVDVNDHVVISYTSCGSCKFCVRRDTSFCTMWEADNFGVGRRDGSKAYFRKNGVRVTSHFFGQSSFARHAIVMARSCVKVAKDLPLEILAPLGCGIMTGSGAMLNVVKPSTRDSVAIVGAGGVGLAALMAINIGGGRRPEKVICVDVKESRLQMASKFGATHAINLVEKPDLVAELRALTDGLGFDAAIDTTGRPAVLKALLDACGNKGVVVSVGVGPLASEVSTNISDTVISGRAYVGCCMGNCYPPEFIPMLIGEWQKGRFPFNELIKTYPADVINSAAEDAISGETVKPVIVWQ